MTRSLTDGHFQADQMFFMHKHELDRVTSMAAEHVARLEQQMTNIFFPCQVHHGLCLPRP